MSVVSEITRINSNIAAAYTQVSNKGGTLPTTQNSNNLADAIESISSGGIDWTQLGYEEEPFSLQEAVDYAKEIKRTWDASITNTYRKYFNNKELIYFPNVDMSNVTKADYMFQNCVKLEYFDEINPASNCNMNYMFNLGNYDITKLTGNKIHIKNNNNNSRVFYNIGILELNELILEIAPLRGDSIISAVNNLKIKKITDTQTSREQPILSNCTMNDDTIKVFLNYFKTLTSQPSSKKTLKALGFTSSNCNQAILLDEWQDLVEDGWTTGY
ncbi:MAG: hypothetical protein J6T74_03915 [Clostridia bacterium]|nr:hypothetical protein [Clostridia bacterium]